MSIQGEIDRINNNVSDALAATAEMGASVPETANSNDLGRLIRSIPQSGGGGTSINVTAEVGQTIVVEEVDANGKPTKWKSADYQPRTHWMERVELLPETTVEINPDEGVGVIPVDFALEAGKPYTIKYNGVEYADCVGVEVEGEEGAVGFGNLFALDQSFPVTEHPFFMLSAATDMDEDGNIDYVVAVLPLDGAESVTLSILGDVPHKLDGAFLPEGTPYLEPFDDVVLEETNLMDYFIGATGANGGLFNLPFVGGITVGNIYEVTFDGVPYLLKAYPVIDQVGEAYFYAALGTGCISHFNGNGYIANETPGLPYSKAPFSLRILKPSFAQQFGGTAMLQFPDVAEGYEPETLAIRGAYKVYATDTKCLPDFSTPLLVTITEERTEDGLTYTPDYLLEEAMCAARNGNLSYLKLSWGDSYRIFHLSERTQWGLKFLRIYIEEDGLRMEHLVWRFDGITVEEFIF